MEKAVGQKLPYHPQRIGLCRLRAGRPAQYLLQGADTVNLKDQEKITITQSAVVLEKLIGQFLYGKAQEGGAKQ